MSALPPKADILSEGRRREALAALAPPCIFVTSPLLPDMTPKRPRECSRTACECGQCRDGVFPSEQPDGASVLMSSREHWMAMTELSPSHGARNDD